MIDAKTAAAEFREGDPVILAKGSYQGTLGLFLRLKEDKNWADITEPGGVIRSHPLEWMAHQSAPKTNTPTLENK